MCSQVKCFSNWGWQTLVKKWLQHSDWFVAYNSKNALTPPWVQMSNECQTLFLITANNFNLMCSYMFFQSFHPQIQLHWWRLCDSVKSSEQKLESGPWVGIVLSYWCLFIWTSFLYLLATVASVVSVSSNKWRRCSLSCSFFWSWLFSCEKKFFFIIEVAESVDSLIFAYFYNKISFTVPIQSRRRSTSMILWSLSAILASAVLMFLSASSSRLMYSSSWACVNRNMF